MTRQVHLADEFLLDAARHFRIERGPHGEPSLDDFFAIDLENIRYIFAVFWDVLTPWQAHPSYRERYIDGRVAYRYYVLGRERPDGSIELLELGVDDDWPEGDVGT